MMWNTQIIYYLFSPWELTRMHCHMVWHPFIRKAKCFQQEHSCGASGSLCKAPVYPDTACKTAVDALSNVNRLGLKSYLSQFCPVFLTVTSHSIHTSSSHLVCLIVFHSWLFLPAHWIINEHLDFHLPVRISLPFPDLPVSLIWSNSVFLGECTFFVFSFKLSWTMSICLSRLLPCTRVQTCCNISYHMVWNVTVLSYLVNDAEVCHVHFSLNSLKF